MSKAQDTRLKNWERRRAQILAAAKEFSMAKVGIMFGISRQRVRQIVQAAK